MVSIRDRVLYLVEPVCAGGLLAQSLKAIWAKLEMRKKQLESLHNIVPEHNMKPKLVARFCRPAVLLLTTKRVALPAAVSPPLARVKFVGQAPNECYGLKPKTTFGPSERC